MRAPSQGSGLAPVFQRLPTNDLDLEANGQACSFWFLKADVVRTWSEILHGRQLPFFQEIRKKYPDALVKISISYRDVVKGTHVKDKLAISHRWMEQHSPDGDGVQLSAIRTFLNSREGAEFKYIWLDASCMPQDVPKGSRTADDTSMFNQMLPNINMIYLGMSVLILLDLSYPSRFWTQAEAWMSIQFSTPRGLVSSIGTPNERHHVQCIHNAVGVAEAMKATLVQTWAGKTPEQAFEVLEKPDVTVTNQHDKAVQLPKIRKLSHTVQEAFDLLKKDLDSDLREATKAVKDAENMLASAEQAKRALPKEDYRRLLGDRTKAVVDAEQALEEAKQRVSVASKLKEEQDYAISENLMVSIADLEKAKQDIAERAAERVAEQRRYETELKDKFTFYATYPPAMAAAVCMILMIIVVDHYCLVDNFWSIACALLFPSVLCTSVVGVVHPPSCTTLPFLLLLFGILPIGVHFFCWFIFICLSEGCDD